MKLYFAKWVLVGFVTAFCIIVGLGLYSYFNTQRFAETGKLVSHTNEVLLNIEKVLANVVDLEAAQRGFIITGDTLFLSSVSLTKDTLHANIDRLFLLTMDNANQQERLHVARQQLEEKIRFIYSTISARNLSFENARDLILSMDGVGLTMGIRKTLGLMQREEKELLARRVAQNERDFSNFVFAFAGLMLATAIILVVVFFSINRNLTARTNAEAALRRVSDEIRDLYNHAPCGYHSLDNAGVFVEINNTLLSWLGYSRDEIVGVRKFIDVITPHSAELFQANFARFKRDGSVSNLEFDFIRKNGTTFPTLLNSTAVINAEGEYVKSRSTVFDISERKKAEMKILQLNGDLEAFTYSVSHDLRAPLRSISGSARILEEDFGSKLDDEGRRVIGVIMRNAKRMGKLIDDLLDFSRLGRQELHKTDFDVNALVRSVVHEYESLYRDENFSVTIDNLLPCEADVATMQQVWINFISNAFKYSAKGEAPAISIGSYQNGDGIVYRVKDNGVGFDMQYAGKLFGVFNRLHKIQEFEGTGVGLAIVHRIITKHGGKVWAEAKLNEGATFYFSVPSVNKSTKNNNHEKSGN